MKVLSCGAGMQSTALALISCMSKITGIPHPYVPIYDLIVFCDLGFEPEWVNAQVNFIKNACDKAGIPFKRLECNLYRDYMKNFGEGHVSSIPFWTKDKDGKKAKLRRQCTIDYKINQIEKYVKYEILGYKKRQHIKEKDKLSHEMHIGFSVEEKRRVSGKQISKYFVNKYPLIDMGWERSDSYKYILETWGLDTKASACCFCPFHTNYFYKYMKHKCKNCYEKIVEFDDFIGEQQPKTEIKDKIYLSKSRKRIKNLQPEECNDAQYFTYDDKKIWNGF